MVGLEEIEVYIALCYNMVTLYMATRPILDLCLAVDQEIVLRLYRQWWEQPDIDILGIKVGHAAA